MSLLNNSKSKRKSGSLFGPLLERSINNSGNGKKQRKDHPPNEFCMWCIKYRWILLILGILTIVVPVLLFFAIIGFSEMKYLPKGQND